MRQGLPHQRLRRQGGVRGLIQAIQGPAEERERCPCRIPCHEEFEVAIQTAPTPHQRPGRSKVWNLAFSMQASFSENVPGLQQLQTSTSSDTKSELEFCRRTTEPFFTIFKCRAFHHTEEIHGNVGYAARPHEECHEKLSDMTTAINLVATLHLYSDIPLRCSLMLCLCPVTGCEVIQVSSSFGYYNIPEYLTLGRCIVIP